MKWPWRTMNRWLGFTWVLVGMLIFLPGCGGGGGEDGAGTHSKGVVVTIFPLWDLARQVAGDVVEVELILPAGRSPHGYELTPGDRMRLREAGILVMAGGGVDSWIAKAAQAEAAAKGLEVLNLFALAGGEEHLDEEEGHAGHEHGGEGMNPHQWLVPARAKELVIALRDVLMAAHAEEADAITGRADDVLSMLDELDGEYRDALSGIADRRMITFHDAFDPLAEVYGIEVVASVFRVEAQQMTPADLQRVERLVNDAGVRAIFTEPQFGGSDTLERRLGGMVTLRALDPLGGRTAVGEGYGSYFEMMRSNLAALVAGLGENVAVEDGG